MWKQNRPRIELESTFLERIMILLTAVIYMIWVGWLTFQWPSLPTQLPAHFDIYGEVDRWGSKYELLTLPIVAGVLALGMIWLRKKPEWHNYPINITEENAPFYYRLSRNLLVIISFVIVAGFAWISWDVIQIAQGGSAFLSSWFLPLFLIGMFGPVIYYVYKIFRYQSKNK